MGISRIGLAAALLGASCALTIGVAAPASADPTSVAHLFLPPSSHAFGDQTLVLSNGNIVVTDPHSDFAANDAGAVYVYNGHASPNSFPITIVIGLNPGDEIGLDGVYEVGSGGGDFVIASSQASLGGINGGAVTWVNGSNPQGAVPVTALNSLYGPTQDDHVGIDGVVTLTNGNYVVQSGDWNYDTASHTGMGAVTWLPGGVPIPGIAVDASTSLVGSTIGDSVGIEPVTGGNAVVALSDGNFAFGTPGFDHGVDVDAGAVTWGDGNTGPTVGLLDATNSTFGAAGDAIGDTLTALTGGKYVINSPDWNNGVGAVTLDAGGGSPAALVIDASNSITGSSPGDLADVESVALTNGNYAVVTPLWDTGTGAVTLGLGAGGQAFSIDNTTSLVGDRSGDLVGGDVIGFSFAVRPIVIPLANGNFVVGSPNWNSIGAATLVDGATGRVGSITSSNSLVGTYPGDGLGSSIVATTFGYAVASPGWSTPFAPGAGAVVFANGTTGETGKITAARSVHGTSYLDNVGDSLVGLADGNVLIVSPDWDSPTTPDAGAVTWLDGSIGHTGTVTAQNSLIGAAAGDKVGSGAAVALSNGGALVYSPVLAPGGAATYVSPIGTFGNPSPDNSAVGTSVAPIISPCGCFPLPSRPTSNGSIPIKQTNDVILLTPDQTPPVLTVPANAVVMVAPGTTSKVVTFTPPSASDPDSSTPPTLVCDHASGDTFTAGPPTTVHCTATNEVGLTATATFTVSVNVLAAPVIVGTPANITVPAVLGTNLAQVGYTSPTASDANGPLPVTCTPPPFSNFAVGTTTVTCTATNLSTATTSFTVTVTDNPVPTPVFTTTQPDISVPTAPGATSATVTFATPSVTDASNTAQVVCVPGSGSAFPVGTTPVTCTAINAYAQRATQSFSVTVTPTPLTADLIPLAPARLADTRPASTTVDGLFAGVGALGAGTTFELQVAGRGGVMPDASAVALNVTATEPVAAGYITVYPCGADRPTASSLNYTLGQTVANAVISKVGTNGSVCIYTSQSTHLVVDVNATIPATSAFVALTPVRVLDTRLAGVPLADLVPDDSNTTVPLDKVPGMPSDASAVVLNVTVTQATAAGYATVYPCDDETGASTLNYTKGATVANLVVANLDLSGKVCIYTQSSTHIVVDVAGYFPAVSSYRSLSPARLLDTRTGFDTVDHASAGIGQRTRGAITTLLVAGRGGVPTNASTVVLNVTITAPTGSGYVTVYPCGIAPPTASNLNFVAGQTVANAVITKVGTSGNVCILNSQPADVVVDVNGYAP